MSAQDCAHLLAEINQLFHTHQQLVASGRSDPTELQEYNIRLRELMNEALRASYFINLGLFRLLQDYLGGTVREPSAAVSGALGKNPQRQPAGGSRQRKMKVG